MSESERMPGKRKRSQVPPITPRASRMANVLPGHFSRRRHAAPTPDRPAPTMRTSTCSGGMSASLRSGIAGRDSGHPPHHANGLLLARARRGDRRPVVRPPRGARALDAGLPRAGAPQLHEHVEPGPAERRLPPPGAPPAAQLPQVRAQGGARADGVGLAGARPAPWPADAAAGLDVLAA